MAPTSRDIAHEAGVSQSTVSRALRRDPRVTAETQRRVQDVAQRLGYVTNWAARSLKMQRNQTIGIVVADLRNPYFLEIVDNMQAELHRANYRTVLVPDRLDDGDGSDLVDLLVGSVDGVVFASGRSADSAPVGLARHGLPVVLINRVVEDHDFDLVQSDYLVGGELAARHLADLGHRRIGLIAGPGTPPLFRNRERSFRQTLDALGVPFDDRLRREGPFSYEAGHLIGTDLLLQTDRPTAIFCVDDIVAFGVLDAAQELGLRVPEDLSVVGYDDLDMAGWARFGLTTIHQPMAEMARDAARLVLGRIEGTAGDAGMQHHVYPTTLVDRASTGPAPS